jgi:hypothetical protein
MTVRRTTVALSILVTIVALAASGCGGSATAVPELTSLTKVAQTSSATDTARFSMSFQMTVPGLGNELSFDIDGAFDTPAKRAELKVDLSSLAELMKSIGGQFGGKMTGDLGGAGDWKLEAIRDGDTVYVNFPLIAKKLPAGKTWIKGDASTLSEEDAGQLGQFGSLAGTDPRDVFGILKTISGSIESVGSDEIRGVETSHYRATIDMAKLGQLIPAEQQKSLGGIDQAAKQAGLSEIPVDIWIDADQRVRKLSIDLDVEQPGTDARLKAALAVEFYDYGKPLELTLPPADQVVDAATLKHTQ